jgi:hypothetical protein
MNANNFSKFILDFINDNKGKEDIIEAWNSSNVQKNFKKLFKKYQEKNDPDRPIKGKTSYLLFCDDYRQSVKNDNPGINNKEITSKLAELWNIFKDTNKEKVKEYEQRSLIEREKYKKDKELYIQNKLNENKEDENLFRKVKETKVPKEVKETKVPKEVKETKVPKEVKETKVPKEDKFNLFYKKKIDKMSKNYPELNEYQLHKKIYKKWMKLSEQERNDY